MVVTNDEKIHSRLRELKDQGRRYRGTGGNDLHPTLGFNFKFTDLQAAMGLAQLKLLPERLRQARQRDAWYRAALKDVVEFPPVGQCQWTDILLENRDEAALTLRSAGIGCREFWRPLHTQEPYKGGEFPIASNISRRGLWLPSGFDLTQDDVEQVASLIKGIA